MDLAIPDIFLTNQELLQNISQIHDIFPKFPKFLTIPDFTDIPDRLDTLHLLIEKPIHHQQLTSTLIPQFLSKNSRRAYYEESSPFQIFELSKERLKTEQANLNHS